MFEPFRVQFRALFHIFYGFAAFLDSFFLFLLVQGMFRLHFIGSMLAVMVFIMFLCALSGQKVFLLP